MTQALYILIGVVVTGLVVFLAKWFGGAKGDNVPAADSEKTKNALANAAEAIGKRAAAEASGEEEKARIESTLKIEDPVERLEAITRELKDL